MREKTKKYKKLSFFGKCLWAGLFLGLWLVQCDVISSARILGTGLLLITVFWGWAFSDKLECEYIYPNSGNSNWIKKIFSVSGRVTRLPYFLALIVFMLFVVAAYAICGSLDIQWLTQLIIIFPTAAFMTVATRRAQDCGYSSWLPFIIPFVMVLVLLFIPGNKVDNKYGPVKR